MRCAHTVQQVRDAEQVLLDRMPEGALMQRAASGLAYAIADYLGSVYGARVLLLVGAGNNGGDALHAGAMLARRGAVVEAVLLKPESVHTAGLAAMRGAGGRRSPSSMSSRRASTTAVLVRRERRVLPSPRVVAADMSGGA